MSWLSQWLHPGDAYKKAGEQSAQYYNQAQNYQQPYNQNGQQAGQNLTQAGNSLLNPEELQSQWASNYEMSPYAKQLQGQAMSSGLDSAASMGLMGSSAALGNLQQGATDVMQKDRQQYMDDLMQKYTQGIGLNQNIYNQGANSASQMGQNAMNQGQAQAGMSYGQNQAGANRLGDIFGTLGNFGANYLTGGMGQGGGDSWRGMFSPPQQQGGY